MGLDEPAENVNLDVYLMNGNKVTIEVSSTDQTDDVLEIAMKKIGLTEKFFYYFALYLVQKEDNGGISSKFYFLSQIRADMGAESLLLNHKDGHTYLLSIIERKKGVRPS